MHAILSPERNGALFEIVPWWCGRWDPAEWLPPLPGDGCAMGEGDRRGGDLRRHPIRLHPPRRLAQLRAGAAEEGLRVGPASLLAGPAHLDEGLVGGAQHPVDVAVGRGP